MPQPPVHRVLYDATDAWFPAWPLAVAGLVVGLVGAGLLRRAQPRAGVMVRTAAAVLAVFGCTWAVVVGTALLVQHGRLRAALADGSFTAVAGVVYDRPPGASGESWVVESGAKAHWYPYGRAWWAPGYRRAAAGSGGVRNGSRVRIADVGGRIARIEVAE